MSESRGVKRPNQGESSSQSTKRRGRPGKVDVQQNEVAEQTFHLSPSTKTSITQDSNLRKMNEPSQASTSGQSQTPTFNPCDQEKRRRFLRDTLPRDHQWDPDQWDRLHFDAQQRVAAGFHSRGLHWISDSAFDYLVDRTAWEDYIRSSSLDGSGLSWPLNINGITPFQGSHSETYKAWLEARGYQATTSQDPNGSGEHPKPQPEARTSPNAQSQGMEARLQAMEARLVQAEARVDQNAMDNRLLREQDAKKGVEIRSLRDRVAQLENAQQTASTM